MQTKITDACPARRQLLATRAHLAAAGLGSQALANLRTSGALLRVRRGVYSPTPLPGRAKHLVSGGTPDPAYVAHVRSALLSLGPTAMAGGRTAAVLWGFGMLVEPSKVEVVVPASRRTAGVKGQAVRRRRGALAVREQILGLEPLPLLSPAETVLDCAVTRPLREAVVIADSALRSGRVTLPELEKLVDQHVHHPRVRRLRRVLALVDPSCESVLESVLRVLLHQHGLLPESQVNLHDAYGRLIGRVDFLFRDQRLVIECDGRRWHDPEDARERDRVKGNELERAAWRLIRVTWYDVVHRPDHVVQLVQDCLKPWPLAA